MNVEKWKVVFYPLTLWLILAFVAFIFGFTSAPDLAQVALLSGSMFPFITAFGYGLWVGGWSHKEFKLKGAIINAFLVAFTVGLIKLLLTMILINNSPTFVTYVTSLYSANATVGEPIINLSISTLLGEIFVAIPAAAAAFTFASANAARKRR